MQNVTIKRSDGKFIYDNELAAKLLRLHKGGHIEYKDAYITLDDISRKDGRDYLHVTVESAFKHKVSHPIYGGN